METSHTGTEVSRTIAVLDHAVLRAAAWPIETIDLFAAPELARAAATLGEAERDVLDSRVDSVAAIHAAVPATRDRALRSWLLAAKRAIHAGSDPLPDAPLHARLPADLAAPVPADLAARVPADLAARVPADLAARLAGENERRQRLAEHRASFERLYAEHLDAQRRALAHVAGEPRFRKALEMAAPTVASAWSTAGGRPDAHTSRGRRLESTVFHYLLRAVGRPTPAGAWSGVAPVTPATGANGVTPVTNSNGMTPVTNSNGHPWLGVEPARARYAVTTHLAPFAIMARALATQPRYRRRPLRINPTLHRVDDGWLYESRTDDSARWLRLPAHPVHTPIIAYYEDGEARPAAPLIDAIVTRSAGSSDLAPRLQQVIDQLIDREVLEAPPRFPAVAADAWDALRTCVEELDDTDRARWTEHVGVIRTLCDELGDGFETLDPDAVRALRERIESAVQDLWTATGLPGSPPSPIVLLDMRLPFSITWSAAHQQAATAAVEERLAFHAADGAAELYRRLSLEPLIDHGAETGCTDGPRLVEWIAQLFTAPPDAAPDAEPDAPPDAEPDAAPDAEPDAAPDAEPSSTTNVDTPDGDTRLRIFSRFDLDDALRSKLADQAAAWEAILAPVCTAAAVTLPYQLPSPSPLPGPGGAMLLSLAADTQVWTGPGRPQPALFAARFATLLANETGTAPLLAQLRERSAAAAARAGGTLGEVIGEDALHPNAAVRPPLTATNLDPHGSRSLRDLRLQIDHAACRVWLSGADGAPTFPIYNSGAAIGHADPCSAALLALAFGSGWEFVSFGFPSLPAEASRWRHLPRLLLSDDTVLSPERWTLGGDLVARLVATSGAERYLAWRAEVERLGAPSLVLARCGPDAPALLLPTDSPLAVRCMFDTIAAQAPWIILCELPGNRDTWPLEDAEGRHYLAELGVTWIDDHYWADAVPGAPPDEMCACDEPRAT